MAGEPQQHGFVRALLKYCILNKLYLYIVCHAMVGIGEPKQHGFFRADLKFKVVDITNLHDLGKN